MKDVLINIGLIVAYTLFVIVSGLLGILAIALASLALASPIILIVWLILRAIS